MVWRLEHRDNKPTKVPYNARTGALASTTNPETWSSFEDARAFWTAHAWVSGVGFVLAADDPYVGVDLDHCRDAFTGEWVTWAQDIVDRLDSYTEVTPSGEGLRIFVRGTLPLHGRKKGNIEVYTQARFLTVTGQHVDGTPETIAERTAELASVHLDVFGPPPPPPERRNGTARQPINLAEADILRTMRGAANGADAWALWNGDWSGYTSRSNADLALCNHLAFYAQTPERVDALFRQSGLMRDKWDEHRGATTYGGLTVAKAFESATEFYSPPAPRLTVPTMARTVDPVTGEIAPDLSPWQTLQEVLDVSVEDGAQLVDGLLWQRRTHWIYSGPGVGKTLFRLAMYLHLAAGEPFCGRNVVQGGVLLFEEDSSFSVIGDYVRLLADIYDFDLAELPFRMNRQQGWRITTDEQLAAADDAINQAPFIPVLVAFDACERIVPSERFNSKELDPFSRLLQRNTGRGMANDVIDHTRKAPPSGKDMGPTPSDPLDLLYGGRTKMAISDIMLFASGGINTTARFEFTKMRGQKPGAFDVSFDAASGFTIRSTPRLLSKTEQDVLRAIADSRGDWTSKAILEQRTGLKERTLERALSGLVKASSIVRDQAGHEALYLVNPHGPSPFQEPV